MLAIMIGLFMLFMLFHGIKNQELQVQAESFQYCFTNQDIIITHNISNFNN